MPSYINDAMHRIAAMQKEALSALTNGQVDAFPFWPIEIESFPYFTNRLGSVTYEQYGIDLINAPYTILMRLVIAHLTEGYRGEGADRIYDYVAAIETYFIEHRDLTTTAAPYNTPPLYLSGVDLFILSHTGHVVFANAGTGTNQIGVEFTLSAPFIIPQIVSAE